MKKIISFSKEIEFKNMFYKIKDFSLEHTLRSNDDNSINGDFIVSGTYKMTEASQLTEEFLYKIPIEIEIDSKYDISDIIIDIDDYNYNVLEDNKIEVNVSLCIDNLLLKEEKENVETCCEQKEEVTDLFLDTSEKEDIEVLNLNKEERNKTLEYMTYTVYIVKENDTIDKIIEEYNIEKELLEEYNILPDIKPGSKLIIPIKNNAN